MLRWTKFREAFSLLPVAFVFDDSIKLVCLLAVDDIIGLLRLFEQVFQVVVAGSAFERATAKFTLHCDELLIGVDLIN